MGVAVTIGAGGADQRRDSAALAGFHRSLAAFRDSGSITGAVLRPRHGLVDKNNLAFEADFRRGLQVKQRRETHDLAGDAAFGRSLRAAKRRHRKRLRKRRNDLRAFRHARPVGHLVSFNTDILETETFQLANAPVPRARLRRRPAKARAHFRRQAFQKLPGEIVFKPGIDQPVGCPPLSLSQRRTLGRRILRHSVLKKSSDRRRRYKRGEDLFAHR